MNDYNALKHQIENLAPWFHNVHLPGGLETAPDHPFGDFPAYKWEQIAPHLPDDLSSAEVLDIGCNAGFYSVELAKRNATVTAIDVDAHYLKQAEFVTSLFDLEERISFHQMQVYDLIKLDKQFDIILFMGVFYHLRYPLLALDIISSKVKKTLVFQSLSLNEKTEHEPVGNFNFDQRDLMLEKGWPAMAFIENSFSGDPTNWWIPNPSAIKAMARSCGLKFSQNPGPEIYFFEPDPEKTNITEGWNKSEFLSAIGEKWLSEVDIKIKKG